MNHPVARVVLSASVAATLVAGVVLAAVGVTVWLFVFAAFLPWMLVLAERWGYRLGVPIVVLVAGWSLLGLLTVLPLLGLPILPAVLVVYGLLGALGVVLLFREPLPKGSRIRASIVEWAPPLAGAFVWFVASAVGTFRPGGAGVSWAMQGDSANNILFARLILDDGGLVMGKNPVPLPAALIALGAAPGRTTGSLAGDVGAFAFVWALVIGVLCWTVGTVATSLIPKGHGRTVGIVGAVASFVPLSWFVTGYPIELGFFNMHIALIIVLLAFQLTVVADRAPRAAFAAQLITATVLLAEWSPLVLVPAGLALAILINHRREVLPRARWQWVGLGLAVVQLLVYGIVVVFPVLLEQGRFLIGAGGVYRFSRLTLIAIPVLLAAAVFAWIKLKERRMALITIALFAGLGAGLAGLIILSASRNVEGGWTYYPLKLLWFMSVIALVVLSATAIALIVHFVRRPGQRALAIVAVAAVAVVLMAVSPRAAGTNEWRNPVVAILSDGYFAGGGQADSQQIFAATDGERPIVYWASGDPLEWSLNFWTMQAAAGMDPANFDLRFYAYGAYNFDKPEDLCEITEFIDRPIDVITTRDLAPELDDACPELVPTIRINGG